jgi:hypothetical protein
MMYFEHFCTPQISVASFQPRDISEGLSRHTSVLHHTGWIDLHSISMLVKGNHEIAPPQ